MDVGLSKWIEENKLQVVEESENVYGIENIGSFIFISGEGDKLIDKDFQFIVSDDELEQISEEDIKFVLFQFGGRYYYSPITINGNEITIEVKFNDFKYLGLVAQGMDDEFCHLGIHSEYEILNGSHTAEDWVNKAKFLKHKSIGICDKNTLAGVLSFQLDCEKKQIKFIIGETVSVLHANEEQFTLKLYVVNKIGWRNLLRINKVINIDNDGLYISEAELLNYGEGLICVFDNNSIASRKNYKIGLKYINKYKSLFDRCYYQWDSVIFNSENNDVEHLRQLQKYIEYYIDEIEPVLINDSYVLDKDEGRIKTYLNKINRTSYPSSNNQYYKNLDDVIKIFNRLFNPEKKYGEYGDYTQLIVSMIENTVEISSMCNFKIEVGMPHLPEFNYNGDINQLFEQIIAAGWEEKINGKIAEDKYEEYMLRVEKEIDIISRGKYINYFLILWDIIAWSREQGIYVGNARGSVAGSLVAFLMGITSVDPILHNLLFERFLSEARISNEIFYKITLDNNRVMVVPEEKFKKLKLKKGMPITEEFINKNLS